MAYDLEEQEQIDTLKGIIINVVRLPKLLLFMKKYSVRRA
jgi:hypothetical protein